MLSQANTALRSGNYAQAIALYLDTLHSMPELAGIIVPNIALARKRHRAARQGKKLSVALCLGPNVSADRVHEIARPYQSFSRVEIIRTGPGQRQPPETDLIVHEVSATDPERFVIDHPCDVIHLADQDPKCLAVAALAKLFWGAAVLAQGPFGEVYADALVDTGLDAGKMEGIVREALGRPFEVREELVSVVRGVAGLEIYSELGLIQEPLLSARGKINHHAPKRLFGSIEGFKDCLLSGWIANQEDWSERLFIAIYIDDQKATCCVANRFRKDLRRDGIGDGRYGFQAVIPRQWLDGREHDFEIRYRGETSFFEKPVKKKSTCHRKAKLNNPRFEENIQIRI